MLEAMARLRYLLLLARLAVAAVAGVTLATLAATAAAAAVHLEAKRGLVLAPLAKVTTAARVRR